MVTWLIISIYFDCVSIFRFFFLIYCSVLYHVYQILSRILNLLSVCLYVILSVFWSLSVCLSLYPSIWFVICLSICQVVCLSVYLPGCFLYVPLSASLCIPPLSQPISILAPPLSLLLTPSLSFSPSLAFSLPSPAGLSAYTSLSFNLSLEYQPYNYVREILFRNLYSLK